MATIFDDTLSYIYELASGAVCKLRNSRRAVKISCFLIIGLIAVFVGLVATGATVAYKVSIKGEVIATVKSKKQYDSALNVVKERVGKKIVEQAVGEPEYKAMVVPDSIIDSEEVVAEAIIDTTEDIVCALSLMIDGESVAVSEDFSIAERIEEYKNSFSYDDSCVGEIVESIDFEKVYCLKQEVSSEEQINAVISGLTVVTNTTVVTDSEIPYNTVYKKVSTRLKGDSAVVVAGVTGQLRITERVMLINGVEDTREVLSEEVISQPSDAVVEVGTARSIASAAERAQAYSSGFIFPLPNGSWRISSYFGDGRGHKGLDICAEKGTSIYAVKGGTVTSAKYDGAYGNCIVINHGDGTSTRYAHSSKLLVSVGDVVETGEVIALVGSTGRSSGNHLHFEVLKNGAQVDPAPYVGLD